MEISISLPAAGAASEALTSRFYTNHQVASDQSVYMLLWPVMVPGGVYGDFPLYFAVTRPGTLEVLSFVYDVLKIQP